MESAVAVPALKTKWLAIGAVAVLLGLVLRAAWVTEDAYITLRTVDNWVSGFGLRWNTDERVQGYTHPLWMVLLSTAYWFTRESFGTTIFVGLVTTLLGVLGLVRSARSGGHAVAAVTLLILSRAFVEFSTSGLENPLTHLLVGLFVWQYAVQRSSPLSSLALTSALLALNRSDALLAVLPALLHAIALDARARGPKQTLHALLVGFSPLLAWEAFSLFYYGILVPNTAYAKLNTGLPRSERMRQGLTYLLNAVAWDPPLLIATGLGIGSAFRGKRARELLLALGALLYVLYVVWIGGDFMLGRFLTLPLFLAVCLVAISDLPLEDPLRAAVVTLPFLLFYWHPAATEKYPVGDFTHSGIADERSYYRDSQLMYFTRTHNLPAHSWVQKGRDAKARNLQGEVFDNVGFFGFYAGPTIHIIDQLALTEPLLARLPATYSPTWRVGHYSRHVPAGYVQTAVTGKCVMEDKNLCEYWTKLHEVVAGDLWSWSRLKTIAQLNLGSFDYLIDKTFYRYPRMGVEALKALQTPIADSAAWNVPGTRTFGVDGLEIELGRVSHAKTVVLSLDGNDEYTVEYRRNDVVLGEFISPALTRGLMHDRTLVVPEKARREGFDVLVLRPGLGDGMYSVGNVRLTQ